MGTSRITCAHTVHVYHWYCLVLISSKFLPSMIVNSTLTCCMVLIAVPPLVRDQVLCAVAAAVAYRVYTALRIIVSLVLSHD